LALALLGFVPTMMINGSLPTEAPNLLPSDGAPLQSPAEEDGTDFSALLLLFLVAPPVQDSALGVDEQPPGVADSVASQLRQEIPHAVPAFAPAIGSTVPDCSPVLIEADAVLSAKNNLPLDFKPSTDPALTALAVEQDNAQRKDGTVLFHDHLNPAVTYASEAARGMVESAIARETLVSGGAENVIVSKDVAGQLSSLPARRTAEIASSNGQPDDSLEFGTSNSDQLTIASSSASPRGWRPTTTQERNLMPLEVTGKKNLGEEMKASQDPLAQHPDLSLPFSSVARHVEEGVKAGDPTAGTDWTPVINRVAGEIISSIRHNKHEAFITLEPPELGNIRIEISLEGERVHARILAAAHDSGRLIENHAGDLKQALQLQSLDLVDLRVDSGSWSGARNDQGQGFRQDFQRQQEWHDGNRGFLSPSRPVDGGETQRSNSVFAANGRVSVWA
jgi:Flagellar hook-length control protein FliK